MLGVVDDDPPILRKGPQRSAQAGEKETGVAQETTAKQWHGGERRMRGTVAPT